MIKMKFYISSMEKFYDKYLSKIEGDKEDG